MIIETIVCFLLLLLLADIAVVLDARCSKCDTVYHMHPSEWLYTRCKCGGRK